MLMVIFGAGASYDSAPSYAPGMAEIAELSKAQRDARLPLSDELFDDRYEFARVMKRFSGVPAAYTFVASSGD